MSRAPSGDRPLSCSADVNAKIANHEKLPDWKKFLGTGEQLCYSFGEINSSTSRKRCEAAIIFEHKPPVTTDDKDHFPFDQTTMSLEGKTDRLQPSFTVNKQEISLAEIAASILHKSS